MARSRPSSRFEIWQVGDRIHSIENPARLKILEALSQRPHNLTELVARTRRAKSTLSALHIPPLIQAGLVIEVPHERDQRVKFYRLVGRRLGSSDVEPRRLRDAVLAYVESQGTIPLSSILAVVNAPDLVGSGAGAAYVEAVARRIGRTFGRVLTSHTSQDAVTELGAFLDQHGLATLEGTPTGGLRVRARDARLQSFVSQLVEEALVVNGSRPGPGAGPQSARAPSTMGSIG